MVTQIQRHMYRSIIFKRQSPQMKEMLSVSRKENTGFQVQTKVKVRTRRHVTANHPREARPCVKLLVLSMQKLHAVL
eukprot:jgi/Antlo1/1576/2008